MGLFRPFDEEAKPIDHLINYHAERDSRVGSGGGGYGVKTTPTKKRIGQVKRILAQNPNDTRLMKSNPIAAKHASGQKEQYKPQMSIQKSIDRHNKKSLNASAALLGISDEEFYELNEGNCNSDTCKCKGGTCPVEVTDGISTSSYAAKKLANAGSSNQTDLNAVKPNAEYSRRNDALFIGDGDSPETSKTNIPAILAARTAGGSPHGWTTDNGINGTGPNVFKLKPLKDDDDGPNG